MVRVMEMCDLRGLRGLEGVAVEKGILCYRNAVDYIIDLVFSVGLPPSRTAPFFLSRPHLLVLVCEAGAPDDGEAQMRGSSLLLLLLFNSSAYFLIDLQQHNVIEIYETTVGATVYNI